MTISNLIRDVIATEAVDYQYNAVLFNDISAEIGRIRSSIEGEKLNVKLIEKSNLAGVISKHTNLSIEFNLHDTSIENAWVLIPDLNRNNPILNPGYAESGWFTERDLRNATKEKGWVEAQVDTAHGQVGGFYSKMSTSVTLTKGLLVNMSGDSYKFTNEEVAAVILHELGHLFTFLESMANLFRRNWILRSRLDDYIKAGDNKVQKLRIVTDLKKAGMLDEDVDTNTIVEAGDKGTCLILTKSVKKINHDDNVYFHDLTAFESASDQFAVRMGAGRHLAEALVKFVDSGVDKFAYFYSWCLDLILLYGSTIGVLLGHVGILIGVIAGLVFFLTGYVENNSSYDKMIDRIIRIRQEMVTPLKKSDVPSAMKADMVKRYDEMEKMCKKNLILPEYADSKSLSGWAIEKLLPSLRKNQKSREYQQLMESLQNNELYVAAARF